jgi:hypothetical protein
MTATKARSVSLQEEAEAQKSLEDYERAAKHLRETLTMCIGTPRAKRIEEELEAIERKIGYWRGVVEAYEQHFYHIDERGQ